MKKKSTKKPVKKISKKEKRKDIETKLEGALTGIKDEFSEKKFKQLIKKAAKLFSIAKPEHHKAKKPKAKKATISAVEAVDTNPNQES